MRWHFSLLVPALAAPSNTQLTSICRFHLKRKLAKYPLLSLPLIKLIYRCWIRRCASFHYRKVHFALRQQQVELLCVWSGHPLALAAATAAAKALGVQLRYFENGLLPGYTVCDPQGTNANNSLPKDPNVYRRYARNHDANSATNNGRVAQEFEAREAQQNRKPPSLPERYVLAPLQMPLDSQILLHSPQVNSMQAFVLGISNAIEKQADRSLNCLVKPHPRARQEAEFLAKSSASHHLLFTSDWSLAELIEKAQGVITINSTVGLEALAAGQKVICLGEACYNLPGLVLNAGNIPELVTALVDLEAWQPDAELRSGFLHYLREHYLIPGDWREPNQAHFAAVAERLRLDYSPTAQGGSA